MSRYLILGNGVAGINAAETIRGLDPKGSLAMVSAEETLPYSRPMISLVLEGAARPEQLPIRGPDYYDRWGIEPFLGHRVVDLDWENREVRTDQEVRIPYEKLLIATGADPRRLKVPGAELAKIFYLRNLADAENIVSALDGAKQALVLGGGLVGFKAAYGLIRRGVEVTMLIRSGHPLTMQVDQTAGAMIQEELSAHGLTVRTGVEATGFEGNGQVERARLSDGTLLECQLVVVGKGVIPALDFLSPGPLKKDYGLRVDEHLSTALEGVYAAGDVAEPLDRVRGEPWVNAIWPVAVEQGRAAGANMAGRPVRYPGSLGRNVMRIIGLDVLTGGLIEPPKEDGYRTLSRYEPGRKLYRKLVLKDRTLVGVTLINRIEQGGVLISLIQRGLPLAVEPETLLEPSFNFATLLS